MSFDGGEMNMKSRDLRLDFAKIIAAAMIVTLHAVEPGGTT